jgi:hypothetical protein
MRTLVTIVCLAVAGCQTDFLGYGPEECTTTPSAKQVERCREVMYINPDLKIEPLGYCFKPDLDSSIRFKFLAQTNDPSQVFVSSRVDASKFNDRFRKSALEVNANVGWWDVSSIRLEGGNFEVPSQGGTGVRGLDVGYAKNADGTLTVYVFWWET